MGKRSALILMSLALLAASCTVNTLDPVPGDKMVFSAVASHTDSKCIISTTTYPVDLPFVVEAVHYPEGTENDWDNVYISGAKVEYDAENAWWQPEEEFLWPREGEVVFYAASPAIPDIHISPEKGVEADWSIRSFEEAQVDLCYAKTTEKCKMHSAVIPIVFDHALTQVCIKVRPLKQYSSQLVSDNLLQSDEITVVLDSVKITGIFSEGHFIQEPAQWVNCTSISDYTIFNDPAGLQLECDKQSTPVLTPLKPLLLIPQLLPQNARIEEWHHAVVHSKLTNLTDGSIVGDVTYDIPGEASIPIWTCCQKWLADYKYTFRLAVGLEDSILSLAVTDWVETREIILDE